jgi:hypothetical protein
VSEARKTIEVEGVLDLSIDGIPARLFAEGRQLRLEVRRPVRLLRGVPRRAMVGFAARLEQLGLTLRVVGRRSTLLVLGRGVSSRAGRLLLRSSQIGFRDYPEAKESTGS